MPVYVNERSSTTTEHYRGGKGRSYQHIINLMPPHVRYVETHLGGGAVMRRKRPAGHNIGIDLDERVIERWTRRELPFTTILQGDAVEILDDLALSEEDLVYADPPYVPSSRRTRRLYRHDYEEADHNRLLDVLLRLPCSVILSGYRCELYDTRLENWWRTEYPALTHNGVVTEYAWANFTPGPILHDYTYVGRTFREREQIRRRCRGLARRIECLEPIEMNAALALLATTHPQAVIAAARRIST